MDPIVLLALLGVFFLGSYIQTVTGFAFGLVVMGLTSVLGLAGLAFAAFLTTLLSLVNTSLALRGNTREVQRPARLAMLAMLGTALPLTWVGLWLLDHFSAEDVNTLKLVLGVTIVVSCLLMMFRPRPRPRLSSHWTFAGLGALAGLLGGLFATYGPPLAYIMYRQPLSLLQIRLTLLMTFTATSVMRLGLALPYLDASPALWLTAALGVPTVAIGTLIGRRYGPPLPEIWMRRLAFALLIGSGVSLIASGLVG